MAKRVIISGGGTGGHIFPAIAIAQELQRRDPAVEILFVGAEGKMEMQLVPRQGYRIEGLPIDGLHRQLNWQNIVRNLSLPVKVIRSLWKAGNLLRDFRPDVVVGTGGYASAAVGNRALAQGIPLAINEQNAYPGLTNKRLARGASRILMGNADAESHFLRAGARREALYFTGNPIRDLRSSLSQPEAKTALGFDPARPLVLSLGGSLGAQALNRAIGAQLDAIEASPVQWFWQCGSRYAETLQPQVAGRKGILLQAFVQDMATALAAADLVVSRAGASTISELIALQKPALLVPSPNVAEDHQTSNARSLSDKGAALLLPDAEAAARLVPEALALAQAPARLHALRNALAALPTPDSTTLIVNEILAIAR